MSPDIAVLLPVRLETRFYPPGPSAMSWRLRVLIVPDEPWIDRHNPLPSQAEMDALAAFYDSVGAGVQSAEGKIAWEVLAGRVGSGARADWLLRSYGNGVQPAQLSTPPVYSRIHGFPDALELWIARGGQPATMVKQWPVNLSRLDVSLPDPSKNDERWYTAWKEAQNTGLGVEVDLGPQQPNDIDVLYVAGIGKTPAEALFANHRWSGALGAIEPGTPTNTVAGKPAADLGDSAASWYSIAASANAPGAGSTALSQALTGRPDAFGALPGDTFDHSTPGHAMMSALWTILWGHTLKDIWNLGDGVQRAGIWATATVLPEGWLPPIRIAEQPYGVLPATSLKSWKPNPADPDPDSAAVEAGLTDYFRLARKSFADLATARGTVSGANTDKLLQLLGQTPSSDHYLYRVFLSEQVLQYFYGSALGGGDQGTDRNSFDRWWNTSAEPVTPWLKQPERKYVASGNPLNIKLPLVAPDNFSRDSKFGDFFTLDYVSLPSAAFHEYLVWAQSVSLLGRMLMQALIVSAAEAHRAANGISGPALEPPVSSASMTQIVQWATALTDAELATAKTHPAVIAYHHTRKAIDVLKSESVGVLDRVLRATIDSACYRIDPWINALPARRIAQCPPSDRPLGAFGWVDSPRPGTPGPTPGGLLHAPSERQALTSAILRDKFINDPQPARWNMNLTSKSVRMAEAIADEVRAGAYIQEVLGRQVERIAGTKALVEQLRSTYPIHNAHAGRRVCDGEAVLKANPASLGMNAAQLKRLTDVRAAVDAYGDLLVAQAVYDVVSGRGAIAGATMDAAAGLSAPPELEVIRTSRTGRSVTTAVAVLLPDTDAPPIDPATSPVNLADPAVAAFLSELLGDSKTENWSWEILLPDGSVQVRHLADLDWLPADAAAASEESLAQLIAYGGILNTAWSVRGAGGQVQAVKLSDLGMSMDAIVNLAESDRNNLVADHVGAGAVVAGELPQPGARSQASAKRALSVLGERPAVPDNLSETDVSDDSVRQELLKRYDNLRQLATVSLAALSAQTAPEALVRAARWGVTPVPAEGESLDDLKLKAIEALAERLQTAPDLATAATLETAGIARTIAQLASSDGKYPVLSRIDLGSIGSKLLPANLDNDWLTVNAAVRMPLARLEAFQLDGELSGLWRPMGAICNRPDDPWQKKTSKAGSVASSSRLIVAFSPSPESTQVAAGLLDSWGETVPDTEQTTSAAFGFNAPAARAPQAVVLAVAPDANVPLTVATTVEILAETRELARARAVTIEDLASYSAAVPMTMLAVGLS
ncbi:MAG TPA: hypothetical protein VER03_26005 [Bryobacteraceae bacterium]|nr:hypothetical protein [Bryobacteraceae bacterium]